MASTGENIENLISSLYKKVPNKEFLPIEDNLICDGIWNKKTQTIILPFEEKETLGPSTKFYLVLTILGLTDHLSFRVHDGVKLLAHFSGPGLRLDLVAIDHAAAAREGT